MNINDVMPSSYTNKYVTDLQKELDSWKMSSNHNKELLDDMTKQRDCSKENNHFKDEQIKILENLVLDFCEKTKTTPIEVDNVNDYLSLWKRSEQALAQLKELRGGEK